MTKGSFSEIIILEWSRITRGEGTRVLMMTVLASSLLYNIDCVKSWLLMKLIHKLPVNRSQPRTNVDFTSIEREELL